VDYDIVQVTQAASIDCGPGAECLVRRTHQVQATKNTNKTTSASRTERHF